VLLLLLDDENNRTNEDMTTRKRRMKKKKKEEAGRLPRPRSSTRAHPPSFCSPALPGALPSKRGEVKKVGRGKPKSDMYPVS
jgi:hypothetical protein